jgi:transposase
MPENKSSQDGRFRYPPELRERAVRLVFETIEETGQSNGAVTRVARQLGIGVESVRKWAPASPSYAGRCRGDNCVPPGR